MSRVLARARSSSLAFSLAICATMRPDRRVERLQRHVRARHGVDIEARVVERGAQIIRAGGRRRSSRPPRACDRAGSSARRRAAARALRAPPPRRAAPRRRRARDRRAAWVGCSTFASASVTSRCGAGLGLLRPRALGRFAARFDLAVDVLRQRANLVLRHIARDDEDRVLRRVEALVIGERVLAARAPRSRAASR